MQRVSGHSSVWDSRGVGQWAAGRKLSVLGVVRRFQRGRKEAPDKGGLLQPCLRATGSTAGRISMSHSPPSLPPPLLPLEDQGTYRARD